MKVSVILIIISLILFNFNFVKAHGEGTFADAEEIIKQKISCDNLTEDQLEILGDYYMEQMHPGELHERMDKMMGGEGSESLRLMHIRMGESFYCGKHEDFSAGMMNIMMGRGMMSNNMMNGYYGAGWSIGIFGWVITILIIAALILLIVWLYKMMQNSNKKIKKSH